MSLLRIQASLLDPPPWCRWALVNDELAVVTGDGPLSDLPRHADRVQLVLPASQVLITRTRLPPTARHDAGSALAFAVEDQTASEPDMSQVRWLGLVDGEDVLAVFDKPGFELWRTALDAAGVREYQVHCETLFLPWVEGEWSLGWNGQEGFVRTGEFEGTATDCGGRSAPPLSLRLLLQEARTRGPAPAVIAVHPSVPDAAPDVDAWARELGVAVRLDACRDWQLAPSDAGISLGLERKRWHMLGGLATRLRPAAWILAAALGLHAIALVVESTSLAAERRALRSQLESRFRSVFPEAVAVADPSLQMRRNLADARHAAGQVDAGDFLPMIGTVSDATRDLPVGSVRTLAYEGGRLTLELAGLDASGRRQIEARLLQAGLLVEPVPGPVPAAGAATVLTVRAP